MTNESLQDQATVSVSYKKLTTQLDKMIMVDKERDFVLKWTNRFHSVGNAHGGDVHLNRYSQKKH